MKIVKFKWREEKGEYSLDVEFPQMWPFQIEEIEGVAAKWGFEIDNFDQHFRHQRQLGDHTGHWVPPESAEAIPAMRNALAALGYTTVFEGEESE
ncbi:hypothetical protein E0J20_09055 [Rhizobium leguminosarum bv. viciae]|nr:hypothetical protein E0J20_09055 [Rhizobium leguminosarum bv. viciae]